MGGKVSRTGNLLGRIIWKKIWLLDPPHWNNIYSKESQPGYWRPIYIGQTNSLETRLANHEKETCVVSHGATHIHTHTSTSNEAIRINEETDLIKKMDS